ncbi:phosphotransferase enzyme family protein [Aureimonas glaciei]|uniref:Aminoglycoside phosphotransferase n=1 Tax=Aureimonas glaciei TaxID=1776957 RepID=A0A916Y6X0_9HYPH|nr:phosphotransferase [Aureimonas glaciei]GGD33548.1 aminoglycoside phosphotransferase [Aureimonas glaciei]
MLYDEPFLRQLEEGLRGALPAWGMPPSAGLSRLGISENALFLASESERRIVLRVHRPHYHSAAEIASELAWIEALRAAGIVETPAPIRARDGALIVRFDAGGNHRLAVAFEHMTGSEPGGDLVPWYGELGAISARMHVHARAWRRPADFVRKRWNFATILGDAAHWGDWRAAPGLDAPGLAVLERLYVHLQAATAEFGEGADRFGLIHGDMRAANLLVDGDRLGVIDFDDCGLGWFGYDFAAAISFIEHEPVVPELQAAWLAGYRRVAPLAPEQERALPMLVMLRRMQLTAWIASHAETPTAKSLGPAFTAGTVDLAEAYLSSGIGREAG